MKSEQTGDKGDGGAAVPLTERLKFIPQNAVLRIDTPNTLGCMDTRSIPVGSLCHEAAGALTPPSAGVSVADMQQWLEALEDILSGWLYIRQSHGDLYGVGWDRAQDKAEAAIVTLRARLAAPANQHSTLIQTGDEGEELLDALSNIAMHGDRGNKESLRKQIADVLASDSPPVQPLPSDHVCGLQGFDGMRDECPGCERNRAYRASAPTLGTDGGRT